MQSARTLPLCASMMMAAGLAACGGGGGGGSTGAPIASLPVAPPAVPVAPASTADTYFMEAPERFGPSPAPPVLASSGGANFTSGPVPGTSFTVLGAELRKEETTYIVAGRTYTGWIEAATSNGKTRTVEAGGSVPDLTAGQKLDWTRYGAWSETWEGDWFSTDGGRDDLFFVLGYRTPNSGMPTAGSATYSGTAQGIVVSSKGESAQLTGNASILANFSSARVTGTLSGMMANGTPWNDVSLTSTLVGNVFSGDARVMSSSSGTHAFSGSATGNLEGQFFGPVAQELGAVWTLFDGSRTAVGTLTGRSP